MLCSFMGCAMDMDRPDDPGMNNGSLCFRACSSILLVHLKGRRPGDARVVTSCTSVVLGYAGSFGYDCAPWCDWGRRQVVTALSVRHNSGVAFSVLPDIRVRCRSSCKEVTGLDVLRYRPPQGGQGWNQPRPPFQGGNNYNSSFNSNFNSNQPPLRELVLGQVKINKNINKKLLANDKSLESLNVKLEALSSTLKNQLTK